jgi:limonene-1,2-epoxide hydrolase
MAENTETNRALVHRFWSAVYEDRDPTRIGAFFHEDGRYEDAALPDSAGIGPEGASTRLALGHAPVAFFDHEIHRMVAEAATVMTEHTATWHFRTGEVIPLPFVSIHVVRDGRFELWRDYWDVRGWVNDAPASWREHIGMLDGLPSGSSE